MLSGLLSMMGMQIVREPKASDFAGLKGAARARAMKRAQKMAKNDYQGARGTRISRCSRLPRLPSRRRNG